MIFCEESVKDEEGLRKLVAHSAENCPVYNTRLDFHAPRYCPLAIVVMETLGWKHPIWAGPYIEFGCRSYNNDTCPIKDQTETTVLMILDNQ